MADIVDLKKGLIRLGALQPEAPKIPAILNLGKAGFVKIVREDLGRTSRNEVIAGFYHDKSRTIAISKEAEGFDAYAIFIHEVLHLCEAQLLRNGEILPDDDEGRHDFITGAADLLSQLIRMNT